MSGFALGFQFLNEADWIIDHLPVMLRCNLIDGIVAVDGGSTDGSDEAIRMIAHGYGYPCVIEHHEWQWDFAKQQNHVIALAEREGYTGYLKWDPDETMFAEQIDQCAGAIMSGLHKAVIVSRFNFEGDREHHSPYLYPDKQLRFVRLGQGFYWSRRLHATTNAYDLWGEPAGTKPDLDRPMAWYSHVNIYHYEGTKPIAERALKWLNYDRVAKGELPLSQLPEGYILPIEPVRWSIPFEGAQPE